MTPATIPQAVQSCHEVLLWVIPQLDKFPCARRFTLGERLVVNCGLENPFVLSLSKRGVTIDRLGKTAEFQHGITAARAGW
jgi:hypothetical protein